MPQVPTVPFCCRLARCSAKASRSASPPSALAQDRNPPLARRVGFSVARCASQAVQQQCARCAEAARLPGRRPARESVVNGSLLRLPALRLWGTSQTVSFAGSTRSFRSRRLAGASASQVGAGGQDASGKRQPGACSPCGRSACCQGHGTDPRTWPRVFLRRSVPVLVGSVE